jgi:hypothetical protein
MRFLAIFLSDATFEGSEQRKSVESAIKQIEEATDCSCQMQKEWRPSDYMLASLPNPALLLMFCKIDRGCQQVAQIWDKVMTEFVENSKHVSLSYNDFLLQAEEYKTRVMDTHSAAEVPEIAHGDDVAPMPAQPESEDGNPQGAPKSNKKRDLSDLLHQAKARGVLPPTYELDQNNKAFKLLHAFGSSIPPVTHVNACVMLEKARHLSKHTALFAPDFKPISKLEQVTTQLPDKCVRGGLLTCSGGKRARVRKVLPVEVLCLKLWPQSLYNISTLANKTVLGQAVADCMYLPPIATLLFAVAGVVFS